jgi:hypothetical protein
MQGLTIAWKDTRRGIPTAIVQPPEGRPFWLHSRFDPLEEARFLVRDVPRQERTLYVVLGFGLGYHVKELLHAVPHSSHVITIEPDSCALSAALDARRLRTTDWTSSDRLHRWVCHDPEIVPIRLADAFTTCDALSLQMLPHIPSTLTAPDFYGALTEGIPKALGRAAERHLKSLDAMLESDLLNFWANLPFTWNATPVAALNNAWSGRPAIIVSAGPSLTDAIPVLRKRQGSAFIIAAATAARVLLSEGIRPDVVVSVDPHEPNAAHFAGWDTAGVPLVYYHRIYRGVLANYRGPAFAFAMKDEQSIPLAGDRGVSSFTRGGTVAFSALQLAHLLNADPVVFVGQDFAFADGHTHAAGTMYDSPEDPSTATPRTVPAVSGKTATTNDVYYSYLLHMQEYLLAHRTRRPDVRHINTSQLGARIVGTEEIPLDSVLQECDADRSRSARDVVISALATTSVLPPAAMRRPFAIQCANQIEKLLARQYPDFRSAFEQFRSTTAYAQAQRSYEHVRYVFESRYPKGSAAAAFSERFSSHLRYVTAVLRDSMGL